MWRNWEVNWWNVEADQVVEEIREDALKNTQAGEKPNGDKDHYRFLYTLNIFAVFPFKLVTVLEDPLHELVWKKKATLRWYEFNVVCSYLI